MKVCPNGNNNDPNKDMLYYALTLTYKKTIMKSEWLIHEGLKFIDKELDKFKYEIVYELTQQGMIHFHGLITVHKDNRLKYLKAISRWRSKGYLLNKQCFDLQKWKEYMRKEETHKVFDLPSQIIDNDTIAKNMYILQMNELVLHRLEYKEHYALKNNIKYWIDKGFIPDEDDEEGTR